MHKQDNTNRDKGLESIMESMYSEAGASDHVPPHDPDKLKRAKERGYDDEQPYDGLDDAQRRNENETMAQHAMALMADEEGRHRDFITWVADSIRAIGKEEFEAKFEALIQDIEGNADQTARTTDYIR